MILVLILNKYQSLKRQDDGNKQPFADAKFCDPDNETFWSCTKDRHELNDIKAFIEHQ
jgi:hypothetical protein